MERSLLACTALGVFSVVYFATNLKHSPVADFHSPGAGLTPRRQRTAVAVAAEEHNAPRRVLREELREAPREVPREVPHEAPREAPREAPDDARHDALPRRVRCGNHYADECALCGGEGMCHGECAWCESKSACQPAEAGCKHPVAVQVGGGLTWRPPSPEEWRRDAALAVLTMSVVLPCAFENDFMERTVRSIYATTPSDVLHEIVVVDDGSRPPLEPAFPGAARFKVKFVRHESSVGLIGAKHAGASAATGDIVVFLDCHVKPALGWWEPFVREVGKSYKRVVVPSITALNVETWAETRGAPGGMSKCILTFDAEFKWTNDATEFVPIMSGGLLGMSRRWFEETGGYDRQMAGWGGENLDQSLRIWRCGGEIVSAPHSFVAHMWRTNDPKTRAKYKVPDGASHRNRARAAKAHMGPWFAKTLTFPDFHQFDTQGGAGLDASSITDALAGLQCQPFDWYLRRFANIYRDAGVLPKRVAQLEALGNDGQPLGSGGLCLHILGHERWGNANAANDMLGLAKCDDARTSGQWWHPSNRAAAGAGANACCSGVRAWNTDQCLAGAGSTGVCELTGPSHQQFRLTASGQLVHQKESARCLGGGGGVGAPDLKLGLADCAGAARWRWRNSFEPMEYEMLPEAMRLDWAAHYVDDYA